ncbi:MAG TPA: hemolysin family protein [Methanocorpusculum sp.]|nr:hemolysin family protein [Methanocorpusculum sp.]
MISEYFLFYVVLFVILLILSACASSSEVALVGINRARINTLMETDKRAKLLDKLKDKPHRFLITILIVNNVVNTAAAAISTAVALYLFGEAGVAIATAVVTVFILIFGEIGPKTYTANHLDKVALFFAPPVYFLTWILSPFYIIGEKISGKKAVEDEPAVTEDEIREWIDAGESEGAIEEEEKAMLYSVLNLNELTVKEIMTPHTDVVIIEDTATLEDAVSYFRETGYSRLPVYHEVSDNIIGVINIKDIFNGYTSPDKSQVVSVKSLMSDVYCVPESKHVDDLMREMQAHRLQMAVILDEFGGFSGIVTFEDIIEELVGDIMDESDVDEVSDIIVISPTTYVIDAQVRVSQLNERFNLNLPEDATIYETIGGLVFSMLGRIPRLGDVVTTDEQIKLMVTKMRSRQILSVKMMLPEKNNSEETDKKEA